jgi:hypothetical protein
MLVHTVLFWLHRHADESERAGFRARLQELAAWEGCSAGYVGTPCADIPVRPVQEVTYDFCLTLIFRDLAAHHASQQADILQVFLRVCAPRLRQVRILDAV